MIFIDTNLFLRLLLKDNQLQFKYSKELFLKAAQEDVKLLTSTVVFFEIDWVLENSFTDDKEKIAGTLLKVLSLNVEFQERNILWESVSLFRETNLSLEDCYNLCFALANKVEGFETFDKKLNNTFKSVGKKVSAA